MAEAVRDDRREGAPAGRPGHLKLFFGAAPGVGKTFEMLAQARRRAQEGVDIVVAIVETHGRAETQAMLADLEVLPRRRAEQGPRALDEMDLDAVLARRPELVLVDELAHTNAPGSRHEKRWQDVLELLAVGIDVWTTMNVQHVESLNDVVAQITRVRVRETVPDHLLDVAEVEVIDLPPQELIERLQAGKVYVPDQAQRALRHFFAQGNLTALRELALRRTAERVDAQMLGYMRAHAIAGPWAASERILVCVDERPGGAQLARHAKRLADQLRAPWTILHVETGRDARLAEGARDRIADTLRLAETLGGRSLVVSGQDVVEEILAQARDGNVTHIVVGTPGRGRLMRFLRGSLVDELVARAGPITIQIVAEIGETVPPKQVRTEPVRGGPGAGAFVFSSFLVALAAGSAVLIDHFVSIPNISFVFLGAVLVSALLQGLIPSLYTSLISVLAYNFLLTEPRYTFTVSQPENVMALVMFFIAAILTSTLMASLRRQTRLARTQAKTTADLYAFSRKLAGTAELDDVLWAAAYQAASMLKADIVILLPEGERLEVQAGYPPEDRLDEADVAAARWSFDHAQPAGRGAPTLPGAARLFLPMKTAKGVVGVMGLRRDAPLLSPGDRRLLDALIDQTALAVERTRLAEAIEQARVQAEAERFRSTILASVSHDLRTPLATIMGTLSSLRAFGDRQEPVMRAAMLDDAISEADRLSRFVANLLDMMKLDTGAIAPRREPVEVGDVIQSALRREARRLGDRPVELAVAPDLPLLQVDFLLLEQVLANILDNAAKYAGPDSPVEIGAVDGPDGIEIRIADHGPGIPAEALERVFDKFYRASGGDRERVGTGLGLAVCRGFVEAMGGRITAGNRQEGAIFKIVFPRELALAATVQAAAS